MPRNSSGIYTLPVPTFNVGDIFESADVNSNMSDIATALTQSVATTGVSVMTGPVKLITGTISRLSLAFANDTDTGFYLSSAGVVSFAIGGSQVLVIDSDSFILSAINLIISAGDLNAIDTDIVIALGNLSLTNGDFVATNGNVTVLNGNIVDNNGNNVFGYPIGAILGYGGIVEPDKWLFCNGQAISRTTYSALYAIIGDTFGAGDGSTTFNVPDNRGRVSAGPDDMNTAMGAAGRLTGAVIGAGLGSQEHLLNVAEMAAHGHPFTGGSYTSTRGIASAQTDVAPASAQTGFTGGDTPHNNVQPTLVSYDIIYAGV